MHGRHVSEIIVLPHEFAAASPAFQASKIFRVHVRELVSKKVLRVMEAKVAAFMRATVGSVSIWDMLNLMMMEF